MRKAVLMASVAIATMNVSPAWAEEAGASAGDGGATVDSGGLADIVVTAQRRSESLQKVPVVVTAVEPEVLEARNVSTLQDLPKLTPSLTVQNQASNVTPFIRGVGSTVTGAGQAASVATYVDGVYIATLTSAAFDLDNVEQVQVLEGPQGALYGRNATGGAIVVTTKTPQPGDPFSGRFRAGYGNYNNREASGIISGGLGDMFAFSVNGSIRKRDGYIKNLNAPGAGTSNADFYDRDSKAIGAVLVFKPSEQFNLVLRAQHFESDDRSGQGYQAVGLDLNVLGTGLNGSQLYYAGFLQSFGVSPADAFAAAANLRFSGQHGATYENEANGSTRGILRPGPAGSFVQLNAETYSAKATLDLGSVEISSLTAYQTAKSLSATEILFADPKSYPAGFQGGSVGFTGDFPSRTWQQELQIASVNSPVQWIAGMLYLDAAGNVLLTGDLPPLSALTADNRWQNRSIAGYGQITVPITDKLSVTAGGRYTDEKYTNTDFLSLADPRNVFGIPNQGRQQLKGSKFTYTGRIQYDTGSILLYAGVSTGFKGATLSNTNLLSPGVKPETITSFEGGAKIRLSPDARLNIGAFHYNYGNIHIAYTDSASGSNILVNGTGAKITGAQYDLLWRVSPMFTLRSNGLVLDTSYDRDVESAGGAGVLFIKGNRLAGAPKFVVSLGADVKYPIGDGELKLSVDASHNAGYYFDAENLTGTGGATARSMQLVDASLTYTAPGDRWLVSLYAANITNEKYFDSGLPISGIVRNARAAPPATYGVRVGFNF